MVAGVIGGQHGEAVPLRLPKEAADGVANLDDVHGDVALADTENLQVCGAFLLRLANLCHEQAQVVPLGLPVHGGLDLRSGSRRQLLAGGDLDEHQPGRVVALLERPDSDDVVLGRPLEGMQSVVLQPHLLALLVLDEVERLRVPDDDRGVVALGEVPAVLAPEEVRELAAERRNRRCAALLLALAGQHPEDAHRVLVVLRGVRAVPREDVVLIGRELDVLHRLVREPHLLLEVRPRPKGDTLCVEGGKVRAVGRPLHAPVTPDLLVCLLALATVAEHRGSVHGVVPVDLRLGLIPEQELLSALLVCEPLAEVRAGEPLERPLRLEFLRPARDGVEVVELHHLERVGLVQRHAIQRGGGLGRLLHGLESHNEAALAQVAFRVHGHGLLVFSVLVDQLSEHGQELVILGGRNLREVADEDGGRECLVHPDGLLQVVDVLALALREEFHDVALLILLQLISGHIQNSPHGCRGICR
mmetsp:Transcript_72394/g.223677  ORF Transcript_72394/g.223677 Transcript_72394/m.223677 type:complete len:474 (-) Transcript_72394:34-1455(-)